MEQVRCGGPLRLCAHMHRDCRYGIFFMRLGLTGTSCDTLLNGWHMTFTISKHQLSLCPITSNPDGYSRLIAAYVWTSTYKSTSFELKPRRVNRNNGSIINSLWYERLAGQLFVCLHWAMTNFDIPPHESLETGLLYIWEANKSKKHQSTNQKHTKMNRRTALYLGSNQI